MLPYRDLDHYDEALDDVAVPDIWAELPNLGLFDRPSTVAGLVAPPRPPADPRGDAAAGVNSDCAPRVNTLLPRGARTETTDVGAPDSPVRGA